MGVIYVLDLNIRLKNDLPKEIFDILFYMTSEIAPNNNSNYANIARQAFENKLIMPNHDLFKKSEVWKYFLKSGESGGIGKNLSQLSRSKLFNYLIVDAEGKRLYEPMMNFIDWIMPYCHESYKDGDILGWWNHDECDGGADYLYYKTPPLHRQL